MDIYHIKTPLGTAKITGNQNGISTISISDEDIIPSLKIPETLQSAVIQLQFKNKPKRHRFSTIRLERIVQNSVWQNLFLS
jgi:methylated-DNA-[protein]-cysteine S-methyltransferase